MKEAILSAIAIVMAMVIASLADFNAKTGEWRSRQDGDDPDGSDT